jgi:hypothetical protein
VESRLLKIAAWLLVIGLVVATSCRPTSARSAASTGNLEHFLAFGGVASDFSLAYPGIRSRALKIMSRTVRVSR